MEGKYKGREEDVSSCWVT